MELDYFLSIDLFYYFDKNLIVSSYQDQHLMHSFSSTLFSVSFSNKGKKSKPVKFSTLSMETAKYCNESVEPAFGMIKPIPLMFGSVLSRITL